MPLWSLIRLTMAKRTTVGIVINHDLIKFILSSSIFIAQVEVRSFYPYQKDLTVVTGEKYEFSIL